MAGIALGLSKDLLQRAAAVTLKEGRPLVVVPREMPLARADPRPPAGPARRRRDRRPGQPRASTPGRTDAEALADFVAAKVLDAVGVEHQLMRRWTGELGAARSAAIKRPAAATNLPRVDQRLKDELASQGRSRGAAHPRATARPSTPATTWPGSAAWRTGCARKLNGDRVFFNVNRHLNLTNVCNASCAYCSFQRKPGEKDAYTMRVEEAVRLAKEMEPAGITELHIVNGLHPTLPWRYYPRVLRELKAALPSVALKAFTATEIHWFEKISGLSADEVLDELIDAGLESLTGGGAEIFDWEIRQQIVDHDTHWEDWSRIHRLAHQKGLRTPCTMLYGHIEEPRHRVDHVLRLRELQDETGGFAVFIPLRFQHDAAAIRVTGCRIARPMATGAEALKTFAVTRLLFDNVPHVKNFWVMHGLTTASLSLYFGADDLDGSVVEYKITHDADGFGTPNTMTRDDLLDLIRDAGFRPVERDTRYGTIREYDGSDPRRAEGGDRVSRAGAGHSRAAGHRVDHGAGVRRGSRSGRSSWRRCCARSGPASASPACSVCSIAFVGMAFYPRVLKRLGWLPGPQGGRA